MKRIVTILFFSVFLIAFSVHPSLCLAQSLNTDSLKNILLSGNIPDTTKVRILNSLARDYVKKDPDKALDYASEALEIVQELNQRTDVYSNMGDIYLQQGKYDKALEYRLKVAKMYEEAGDKSSFAFALGEIGKTYRETGDFEKALEFHQKASNIYEEIGDTIGLGYSLDYIGGIYRERGNYEKALEFHLKASAFKEETGDKSGLGNSYNHIGKIYKEQGKYEKALEFHLKAVKFKEEMGDRNGMSYTFGEVGNIYSYQGNYDKAIEFHFKAAKIREELEDKRGLGYTFAFIGKIYSKQGNYDKALQYYLKSSNICKEIGNKKGLAIAFDNIGKIYADLAMYEIALSYQMRALKINKEMGNKRGLIYSLGSIGKTYVNQKQYDKALDYQKNSLKLAKEIGSQTLIRDAYSAISKTYSLMNDYKNALEYYQLHTSIKDSIFRESSGKMAEIEAKYKSEKKDREIKLLQKDKEIDALQIISKEGEVKKQRILIFSSVGALFLALALAFLLYNRSRIKQYANLKLEHLNQQLEITNLELEKQSTVVKKTNNYVIITDKSDLIEWVNESFTRIYGYSKEEIIGKRPSEILRGPGTSAETEKEISEKVLNKESFTTEVVNYDKKGELVWVSINATPIVDNTGVLSGFVSIGNDITQRKKDEEAINKQKEEIEEKNKKLWQINLSVHKEKEKAESIKQKLEEKNKDITDSINYAQKIQNALLPDKKAIAKAFPESFILYRPKDIVSGDFYYYVKQGDKHIIAAVDCTGHGVPGALMSMIGHELLNQIIVDRAIVKPSEILNQLHRGLQFALQQEGEDTQASDGMDLTLCNIDLDKNELEYAGANRPLYLIGDENGSAFAPIAIGASVDELEDNPRIFPEDIRIFGADSKGVEIIADRYGIGEQEKATRNFTNHQLKIEHGDTIYIFSDGIADQFGGPKNRKFMTKKLKELLYSMRNLSMDEQHEKLKKELDDWMNGQEQTDDILLIGIRFPKKDESKLMGIALTDADLATLKPLMEDLSKLDVYDAGRILELLKTVETNGSETLKKWYKAIETTVFNCDEENYRKLLNC